MGIELLIGAIQAYIFTVLAMVFVGSVVREMSPSVSRKGQSHE
jgi:F0F1-type ATP synthase membrane subunit a